MTFSEIVRSRRSIKSYDPNRDVTDEELREIFEEVVLSPSSFNLQHWKFIVVRDPDLKKGLRAAAWDQPQVEEAAVAIVVCGKLDAHNDAPEIYRDAPPEIRARLVPMIAGFYDHNPQKQHDEALRSGSLAAMMLMLSARDRGIDTGPMIGFDPDRVKALLHITDNHIPVMMVVLGHRAGEPRPRDRRRPLAEVVRMNTLDGPGLGEA